MGSDDRKYKARAMHRMAIVALSSMALLGGCADDGIGPAVVTVVDDLDVGSVFQELIPATGGSFTTNSGGATLTFPPGALANDMVVSIDVQAARDGSASSVYVFSPQGLTLQTPVRLALRLGSVVPDAYAPAISYRAEITWVPIVESTRGEEFVIAEIGHFAPYTVTLEPLPQ